MSEHVQQTIETFRWDLGWDQPILDRFFSTSASHYMDAGEALRLGIVHALGSRIMSADSNVHLIEP